MISTDARGTRGAGLLYILGVRERTDKLVRELVLDDPAPFIPFFLTRREERSSTRPRRSNSPGGATSSAAITTEARKDAADRAGILAGLERELKKGDKALVGNKGYRRF